MTERMLAYLFREVGRCELTEAPVPTPSYGEALIRVSSTSLCTTDLKIMSGLLEVARGRIIGHEGVGVVTSVGPMLGLRFTE